MKTFCWMLVTACLCVPCHADRFEQEEKATGPIVIAKGEGYSVHGFFGSAGKDDRESSLVRPGVVLLYQDTESDEMTWLTATGTYEVQTRRVSYTITRLVGRYQTQDYLVLVMYHSGRIFDQPPRVPPADQGMYMLSVYGLKSGERLRNLNVDQASRLPKDVPDETLDEGVVKKTDAGFELFAVQYKLDGDGRPKVIEHD